MASIRKRGELQWEACVRRRGQPVQCKTFTTKARAAAWVRQVEGGMDRGVFVSRAEAENTTLAEALARYEQEVTPRKKTTTASRERDRIRAWAASSLSQRSLASVRGKDVAVVLSDIEKRGLSANIVPCISPSSRTSSIPPAPPGAWNPYQTVDLVKGQRPKLPAGRDRRLVGNEETRLLAAAQAYDQVAPPGTGNTWTEPGSRSLDFASPEDGIATPLCR